ncbi:hypothetical protein Q6D67_18705 [Haliea sp. E1-2-M8]|uniref:hypothetical protein n=1 Tax=Haliea sp. E1-2-M8 TaxID=3064706 RepID=UPI00271C4406|nr:hypothetical protein [Haliea sp. E1-2-M8]MDO8863727.1 hypothetical protein [Haliea sp. E1-2-M8]
MSEHNQSLNLRFRLARQPSKPLKPHNQITFEKVQKCLQSSGGVARYQDLEAAARGHQSGDAGSPHPHQFIDYLIKIKLLAPVDQILHNEIWEAGLSLRLGFFSRPV